VPSGPERFLGPGVVVLGGILTILLVIRWPDVARSIGRVLLSLAKFLVEVIRFAGKALLAVGKGFDEFFKWLSGPGCLMRFIGLSVVLGLLLQGCRAALRVVGVD